MSEDQFTKLFKYMQKVDEKVDRVIENMATKQDIERIFQILDDIAKRQEVSDDERLVMGHQLERLDRWVHDLAKHIGYKLPA